MNLKEELEARRRKNLQTIKRAMSNSKGELDSKTILKLAKKAIKVGSNDKKTLLQDTDQDVNQLT